MGEDLANARDRNRRDAPASKSGCRVARILKGQHRARVVLFHDLNHGTRIAWLALAAGSIQLLQLCFMPV